MCGGDENPSMNFTRNPVADIPFLSPQTVTARGLLSPRAGFNFPQTISELNTTLLSGYSIFSEILFPVSSFGLEQESISVKINSK